MSKQKILLALLLISGILLMMSGTALAEVIQYDGYSLDYSLNYSSHTAEVSEITNVSKSGLNVMIPENITVNGTKYNVTSIGDFAFCDCVNLISIECPHVTIIGEWAFHDCSNLSFLECPAVTIIGDSAFGYCSNLSFLECPAVTIIGDSAFEYCSNLSSISCSQNVSFGSDSFYNTSLSPSVRSLSFNANNGSGSMNDSYYVCYSKVKLPECEFKYDGKSFSYWSVNSDGSGTKYYPGELFELSDNSTLYAVWTDGPITYTISYSGGNVSADYLPDNESVEIGSVYTVPQYRAAADGYIFKCWSDNFGNEIAPGDKFRVNSNIELTAQWFPLPKGLNPSLSELVSLKNILFNENPYDAKYDLNGDGEVDLVDLVLLSQYIADY